MEDDSLDLTEVKKIITEECEKAGFNVVKIILFGSRVRGDYTEESDWDLLVILDKYITFNELKKLTGSIQLKLAAINFSNDLIFRGINQFNKSMKVVGNISYYANKEGIEI
jgi:predicted nucleotidyltransferase